MPAKVEPALGHALIYSPGLQQGRKKSSGDLCGLLTITRSHLRVLLLTMSIGKISKAS